MSYSPDGTEVIDAITKCISEALLVPKENISPSSRLVSDLDAESIDIADIRFRLEQEFHIRIDQKGMMAALGENLTNEEFNVRFTVQFVCNHVMEQKARQRGNA